MLLDSVLVWFRRDLRDHDHTALDEALRRARRVYCVFIFDRQILAALADRADRRIEFIRLSLCELDAALRARGGALLVRHAHAAEEIPRLAMELAVSAVFANRDYEPLAKARDDRVAAALRRQGCELILFKDQVLLDGEEVLNGAGQPYTVFTPYKKAWLKRLTEDDWSPCATTAHGRLTVAPGCDGVPSLSAIGFASSDLCSLPVTAGMSGGSQRLTAFRQRIADYRQWRDFPALQAGSCLSVHLRFGTVSIREAATLAIDAGALREPGGSAATWLGELIWREFFFMIVDRFPWVAESAFKPAYDAIEWSHGEEADALFVAWTTGQTGFPLIDAAMTQLNLTGDMHNRLRMVTASFLCKDLGINWRRGEAYFARQLLDFDLAANNGGWQWAASSGCDAQPYFRIFNPLTQSMRFDPQGTFIRRYLPKLTAVSDRHIHAPWLMSAAEQDACGVRIGQQTPAPLVDHATARQRTRQRFAVVKRGR